MKKFALAACAALFATSLSFGADGAAIFNKCKTCHQNPKGEMISYLNKVPVLTTVAKEERLELMKKYKAGEENKFGMGGIMKSQMATLSEEDMAAVNDYIETLK